MNKFDKIVPIELESLDIEIPANMVLVEYKPELTKRSQGGIILPEHYKDNAANSNRMGKVVIVPKSLDYYRGPDKNRELRSMPWKTTIDILPDDTVWFNHIEALNAYKYTYKGKHYKTIHYQDIIAAKRGVKKIICNGYVLLEECYVRTRIGHHEKRIPIPGRGKVAYFGDRVEEYNVPEGQYGSTVVYRKDLEGELKRGSIVYIMKEQWKKVRYMEDNVHARFEGKKMFVVVRRYMIGAMTEEEIKNDLKLKLK